MNLNQYSDAAAQPGLAADRLANLFVCKPPLQEQKAIADYLDRKTAEIDSSISTAQKKIEVLKAYRSSLISAVVTGKKPVTA